MRARDQIILRNEPLDDGGGLMPYNQPPPLAQALPTPSEQPEPSLFGGIFRHFWLVILFAAVGGASAWFLVKRIAPVYTSEARIYIEASGGPRVLAEALASAQRSNYLYTQCERLRSSPLLSKLLKRPEIKDLRTWGLAKSEPLYYLRTKVQAEVGRKDDILSISIESPVAEDAATIVNALVQEFITDQTQEKNTASTGLLATLQKARDTAATELAAIEASMLQFQQKNPSLNFDALFHQELQTLSAEFTRARLATIEAKASYQPGHPQLQKAQAREQELYAAYGDKLKQVMSVNSAAAEYQKLASDLAQKKDFVKQLDERIRELELGKQQAQIIPNITVLEPARVPERPSFPRPLRATGIAVAFGGLLGAVLAFLRDRLDGRMRSVEEIQTVIGLPILGVVPAMSGRRTAVARAMTVHLDPRSVVAEAYRTIRTAVYFGTTGSRCKTILLTSPEPGDGKTTCASNLAIAIAQTGRSVLLLDADFRKPTQHKNLDIKDALGLSSVLAGRESLERAIQRTGVEGLDILPCGPIPANPSEILNSREFGELVDGLCGRYDHIIFDSPPVNAVTDARILGAVCDATVLVLRADKSTKKAGEHARNALLAVGARMLGAIVNDAPKGKGYEVYGGYGKYYGTPDATRQTATPSYGGNGHRRLPQPTAKVVS